MKLMSGFHGEFGPPQLSKTLNHITDIPPTEVNARTNYNLRIRNNMDNFHYRQTLTSKSFILNWNQLPASVRSVKILHIFKICFKILIICMFITTTTSEIRNYRIFRQNCVATGISLNADLINNNLADFYHLAHAVWLRSILAFIQNSINSKLTCNADF